MSSVFAPTFTPALPDDVCDILRHSRFAELADHGQGLIRAAGNPERYWAFPQVFTDDLGVRHLLVTKPRTCWMTYETYLGICYLDSDLIGKPLLVLEAARAYVDEKFGRDPRRRISIRGVFDMVPPNAQYGYQDIPSLEDRFGFRDPEDLRHYIPAEIVVDAEKIDDERRKMDDDGQAWKYEGYLVQPVQEDQIEDAYKSQIQLNTDLRLNLSRTLREGLRKIVFDNLKDKPFEHLWKTQGVLLGVACHGRLAATAWAYLSFNCLKNRWTIWLRRIVKCPGYRGGGITKVLFNAAIGLLGIPGETMLMRTLVHPQSRGANAIRTLYQPQAQDRHCLLVYAELH